MQFRKVTVGSMNNEDRADAMMMMILTPKTSSESVTTIGEVIGGVSRSRLPVPVLGTVRHMPESCVISQFKLIPPLLHFRIFLKAMITT